MEKLEKASKECRFKTTFVIYLDLAKQSYRNFAEPASITAGRLVNDILNNYAENGIAKGA